MASRTLDNDTIRGILREAADAWEERGVPPAAVDAAREIAALVDEEEFAIAMIALGGLSQAIDRALGRTIAEGSRWN